MRFVSILLLLFFLISCAKQEEPATVLDTFERIRQQGIEQASSDFERLCYENRHSWMKMRPAIKGVPTSDKACFGCMPEGNTHICDEAEYRKSIEK